MTDSRQARDAVLSAAAVVPHTDADGLAAGAIALRARGQDASAAVLLGRGRTPFSPGAGLPDDLRAFLRRALPDARGEFAHGHDRATGGSLPADDFDRLLAFFAR